MATRKLQILFLCTGNSCRSQMAEGLCRHFKGRQIEAYSAGIEKHGLNPLAIKVMKELGIDISGQKSKTIDELPENEFDYVITLCGQANETCPYFPARTKIIHRGFPDPPQLAAQARNEEQALPYYRQVRDQIKSFILELPHGLY